MRTVELAQAGAQLARLVHAGAGTEVVITEGGRPVAKLVPVPGAADREPGSARGLFTVPDDFDAPLDDFREYT